MENEKKHPKWLWRIVYILFGLVAILVIAAIFGDNNAVKDYEIISKIEGNGNREVEIFVKTSKKLDSVDIIKIAQEARLKHNNTSEVGVSFCLTDEKSKYATVFYPSAEYVREETKNQDSNGNKFNLIKYN